MHKSKYISLYWLFRNAERNIKILKVVHVLRVTNEI